MSPLQPVIDRKPPLIADGYVLAASVVDTFKPERLEPAEGFEADMGKLLELAVMSEREDGTVEWRLPNDIRRPALRLLAERQRLERTLASSKSASDPDSPYQRIFEAYVHGDHLPLEQQDIAELQASLNAVKLLEGVVRDIPDERRVRAALVRRDFVSQFEQLVGRHFVGRVDALQQLREFVDVLPTGMFGRVRRIGAAALGTIGIHSILYQMPLMITGMGGMGKSALLSKFVLEHVPSSGSPDLLFAYIDFDRPGIWPDQPLTVLAEISRQLGLQVPEHAPSFDRLSNQIVSELSVASSHGENFDSSEALLGLGTDPRRLADGRIEDFAMICRDAFPATARETLLLVLDTFEEVSQRSLRHQEALLDFIGRLQRILPRLRVVISGRGMHPDDDEEERASAPRLGEPGLIEQLAKEVKPLELTDLDEEEAVELLEALGSPSWRLNKAIVRRIGGHPLSLRLAAQLVETVASRTGKAPEDLNSAELFGGEWLKHMSEGLLYRRIIAHIADAPLQKLADPGLILRELTADIVFEVLNEPCDLKLRSAAEAMGLFERLKQFNQLVTVQSESAIRHRPELRKRILREMMHGKPKLCSEIWTRAARHYEERDENRTEELYCRLMLDEDSSILVSRWVPGLEKRLLKSRGEMPVRARQFLDLMALASDGRSQDVSVSSGELDLALLTEEMKLLLSRGSAKEALDLFRATSSGRAPRFDGALYGVYVRAIAQAGDLDTAMSLATKGLDRLDGAGRAGGPRYEELLLLCCQITRAQHAANAGTFRIAVRRALRRMTPVQADALAERFLKLDFYDGRPLHALRIAVALLELYDVEANGKRELGLDGHEGSMTCAVKGFDALQRLGPDYAGVDGALLVRSLAWLSAFFGATPVLSELLSVPQVVTVLRRDYAKLQLDGAWTRRGGLTSGETRLESWAAGRPFGSETRPISDSDIRDLGQALRSAIAARDSAQGSQFS